MRVNKHPMDEKVSGIRVLEFFSDRRQEPFRYVFNSHPGTIAVMTFSEGDQSWHAYTDPEKKFISSHSDPDTLITEVLSHLSGNLV